MCYIQGQANTAVAWQLARKSSTAENRFRFLGEYNIYLTFFTSTHKFSSS